MSSQYDVQDLLELMDRLRDPETGCPWDLKQDYRSIVPHTVEETYEVADAIERGDLAHLPDELGDLLFQVVFYARLGKEEGRFDFDAVVDQVTRKLIRRHPHIFPDGTLESRPASVDGMTDSDVLVNWDRIKAEEAKARGEEPGGADDAPASQLDDITPGLPAFQKAAKLQKRAAKVGFDWPDTGMVFEKLAEESRELRAAYSAMKDETDTDAVEDELGDLLFVAVNLSRFLGVDAEQALRRSNRKFERRFRRMETMLAEEGVELAGQPVEQLELFWQDAKQRSDADTPEDA
ncbi:ATP diphosphatase [Halospina denitrificans]|uniref:Nucleoside triphosphate pyrophosphohydrolase n=1 Tax=Halospina denitrificans TaxID=332522 RepID=A0A4R7JL73_9GAMM|nr:nucleoside triphosphate pyrophosphohydrolase [Halospina denitrificans]TDT38515.1 ATP diphosphatase [Halospina denitrificans]